MFVDLKAMARFASDPTTLACFAGCWIAFWACLWGLWRFGMREMAFFRLVLEIFGTKSWLRWSLGIGASFGVSAVVFVGFFLRYIRVT